jgi:hypothetical protein
LRDQTYPEAGWRSLQPDEALVGRNHQRHLLRSNASAEDNIGPQSAAGMKDRGIIPRYDLLVEKSPILHADQTVRTVRDRGAEFKKSREKSDDRRP